MKGVILVSLAALLVCSGCSFAFFESEVAIIPHELPQVADRAPVVPQSFEGDVAALTELVKLLPLREWFTGEKEVKQTAISGNTVNGAGVEYRTKRRFFVFGTE